MSWSNWNQASMPIGAGALQQSQMTQMQQQYMEQANMMHGLSGNMAQYMNSAMQSQYNLQGTNYTPQQWAAMQQWNQQWQQMGVDPNVASNSSIPQVPVQPPLPVEPPPDVPPSPVTSASLANMSTYSASASLTQNATSTHNFAVPPPQYTMNAPPPVSKAPPPTLLGKNMYNNSATQEQNSYNYPTAFGFDVNAYVQSNFGQKEWLQQSGQLSQAGGKQEYLENTKQTVKRANNAIDENIDSKKSKSELTQQQLDEENEFDTQFQKWEADFNAWREQNANHPDKKAYRDYEMKFLACRNKLLERREQMRAKRQHNEKLNAALSDSSSNKQNMAQKVNTNIAQESQILDNPSNQNILDNNLALQNQENKSNQSNIHNDSFENSHQRNDNSQMSFLSENSSTDGFLKSGDKKGIPGLDLVPEDETNEAKSLKSSTLNAAKNDDIIEINDDPEPVLKTEPSKIVLNTQLNDAISNGINAILADQKLLSMLSIVTQCQNKSEIGQMLANNKTLYEELSKNVQEPSSNTFNTVQNVYSERPTEIKQFTPVPAPVRKPLLETPKNISVNVYKGPQSNDSNFSIPLENQRFQQPDEEQGFNFINDDLNSYDGQNNRNTFVLHGQRNMPENQNSIKSIGCQDSKNTYENELNRNSYNNEGQNINCDTDDRRNIFDSLNQRNLYDPFQNEENFDRDEHKPLFKNAGQGLFGDYPNTDQHNYNINANTLPSLMDQKITNPVESLSITDIPNLMDLTPRQIHDILSGNTPNLQNFMNWQPNPDPTSESINPMKVVNHGHKPSEIDLEASDFIETFDYNHKSKPIQSSVTDWNPSGDFSPNIPPPKDTMNRVQNVRTKPSRFSAPNEVSQFDDSLNAKKSSHELIYTDQNRSRRSDNLLPEEEDSSQRRLNEDFNDRRDRMRQDNYYNRSGDKFRDVDRYRERSKESDKGRDGVKFRGGERFRDIDRPHDRERSRDGDRFRDSDRSRDFEKNRNNGRFRDNDRFKESDRNRDNDRYREKERFRDGNRFRSSYENRSRFDNDKSRKDQFGRDLFDNKHKSISNVQSSIDESVEKDVEKKTDSIIILIDDILMKPGREHRPQSIVIILRGPPGSGKTHLAKLIKETEQQQGGPAPRILSLDDYFMVEKEIPNEGDNRKGTKTEMCYDYDTTMEKSYRDSLIKSFKKTLIDGFFNFVIVDCINNELQHYEEMWLFAKQRNWQVYICQLDLDLQFCLKHNIHKRSEADISSIISNWQPTPSQQTQLDVTSMLQRVSISEVEMEDAFDELSEKEDATDNVSDIKTDGGDGNQDEDDDEISQENIFRSKWDNTDQNEDHLARLDGTSKPLRHQTMEEYLAADWEPSTSKSGKKRVRWADIEEKRAQDKMRDRGFVVGHTDWNRMMDPTGAQSALTQTKYIERVNKSVF